MLRYFWEFFIFLIFMLVFVLNTEKGRLLCINRQTLLDTKVSIFIHFTIKCNEMNTCHNVTLYRHGKFYFSHSIIFFTMLCINWNFFIPSLDLQMFHIKSSFFFFGKIIFPWILLLSKLPSYLKRLQTFRIKAIFQSLNFWFASFFSKEIKSSRQEQFINGKSFFS